MNINIHGISYKAFQAINALDETFIGTPEYMGVQYFWGHEYKWALRDMTYYGRRKVHHTFLKEGLILDETSPRHAEIVKQYAKRHIPKKLRKSTYEFQEMRSL